MFFWSLGIWNEFTERNEAYHVAWRGTNLCHFVRVICLYLPLVFLLYVGTLAATMFTLIVLPIELFGGSAYVLIVVSATFVTVLIIAAVRHRRVARERRWESVPTRAPSSPRRPSFVSVVWQGIVATKRHVCPLITFAERRDKEVASDA